MDPSGSGGLVLGDSFLTDGLQRGDLSFHSQMHTSEDRPMFSNSGFGNEYGTGSGNLGDSFMGLSNNPALPRTDFQQIIEERDQLRGQLLQYQQLLQLLQQQQNQFAIQLEKQRISPVASRVVSPSSSQLSLHDDALYLLDDEEYPFPKYTVNESTVRPYPVMIIRWDGKKENLLVKAEPAPGYKFKMENHIAYYKPKDQSYLHRSVGDIIVFELLHVMEVGNAEGEPVQIDFSLYYIEGANSTLLARKRSPPITVFNHSQYLPAPSISKLLPSWAPAGNTPKIDAFGPLFLRKNNILECQIAEADGREYKLIGGNEIVRKRNCFHSFTFTAPSHDAGKVAVRSRYKGREFGAHKFFDYIQPPMPLSGTNRGVSVNAPRSPFGDTSGAGGRLGNSGSSSHSSGGHPMSPNGGLGGSGMAFLAYTNDLPEMRIMLEQLGDKAASTIHTPDENGFTPLMWAAYQGHVDAVTLLLNFGASVNRANALGETALHMAVYNDHTAVTLELLKAGAKTSVANKRDAMLPLHIAAYFGFINSTLALLDDALDGEDDLGTADRERFTPLHYAVLSGSMEVLTLLLERCHSLGESVTPQDANGMTPLMWAVALDNPDMVREILRFSDVPKVNMSDANGETALFHAIRANNIEICRELLSAGSAMAINHRSRDMETPLFLAVRERNNNIVHLLMEYGADITARNKSGKLPLELVDSVLSLSMSRSQQLANSGQLKPFTFPAELGITAPLLPNISKPASAFSEQKDNEKEKETDANNKQLRVQLVSSLSMEDFEFIPRSPSDTLLAARPTSPPPGSSGPLLPSVTPLPGISSSSSSPSSTSSASSATSGKAPKSSSPTPNPKFDTATPPPTNNQLTVTSPRSSTGSSSAGSSPSGRRANLSESAIATIAVQTGEVTSGNPALGDGHVTPGNPALEVHTESMEGETPGNPAAAHRQLITESELVKLKAVQHEFQEKEAQYQDKLQKAEGEVDTLKGMVSALTAEVAILRRRLGEPIH